MPRRRNTAGTSKVKPVFRTKETITGLVQQIATARSGGSTLTQALKQANVPYNTYSKWIKKSGSAAVGTPAKADKILRSGKTESEIRTLLKDVAVLRAGGMTRTKALKQMGVLSTTHDYWTRKYGKPVSTTPEREGGTKRRGKSEDEIRKLLREIAISRNSGTSIAQATKQAGVLRTTYNYWVKRYAEPGLAAPVKKTRAKKETKPASVASGKGTASRGKRKSSDEVRGMLGEIAALRKAGKTKDQALAQVGINPYTYKYWRKKYDGTSAPKAPSSKKTSAPAGKKSPLASMLREMAENREKRQELEQAEKQIQALDARYKLLRKQLGS